MYLLFPQIFTEIKDLRGVGIAHSDVKPPNAMLFSQSLKWKPMDLDEARKADDERAVCFTTPRAAPKWFREWRVGEELPVSQPFLCLVVRHHRL